MKSLAITKREADTVWNLAIIGLSGGWPCIARGDKPGETGTNHAGKPAVTIKNS